MSEEPLHELMAGPESPHFTVEGDSASGDSGDVAPWTEIAEGRFMPRRVRGSCHGRALG